MKEVKVYAINIYDLEQSVRDAIDNIGWNQVADWEFMDMAEEQGYVWSLSGFEEAFNDVQIATDIFCIRIR
jgi:hypothetical protein